MMYAEITDLEAGWREMDPDEVSQAEELLMRSSIYLDTIVEQYGIDTGEKADALRIVCCDLTQRRMEHATSARIVSETMTTGTYSETTNYGVKGSYSWRLTDEDKRLLGISKRSMRLLPMW
ncbi:MULTISPECIES: hypothetical protein [unclassified Adlercreutzia]|uniref:hypothetical protein n=1 Tax=unclassified Adlercreutzia TaxID=2636013 RepID=UPI0013ED752F|nr:MULTISPECIES: hypothetical protein [unclassified Adlercreutzia]